MVLIDQIFARQILDSRGYPTLEVEMILSDGALSVASVPSGTSRGTLEAVELRDKDFSYYFGMSVEHAVKNINDNLAQRLKKQSPLEQEKIDRILLEIDQTPNKAHLGSNTILALSLVSARSAAKLLKKPLYRYLNELFVKQEAFDWYEEIINLPAEQLNLTLPMPIFNLINGGQHAAGGVVFQEYWLVPLRLESVYDQVRAGAEVTYELRNVLRESGEMTDVGLEGGFTPNIQDEEAPFELIKKAIQRTRHQLGQHVYVGLDCAANTFYLNDRYVLGPQEEMTTAKLSDYYAGLMEKFPFYGIEDPFAENDQAAWKNFRAKHGSKVRVIGDDLTATNRQQILKAIDQKLINGVAIKPNQVGTLTETLQTVKLAKAAGYTVVVSHRSGETNDDFLTDLAVGVGANLLKAGAPVRGERVAKYNRLLKIADETI